MCNYITCCYSSCVFAQPLLHLSVQAYGRVNIRELAAAAGPKDQMNPDKPPEILWTAAGKDDL